MRLGAFELGVAVRGVVFADRDGHDVVVHVTIVREERRRADLPLGGDAGRPAERDFVLAQLKLFEDAVEL
jgi:hypothetical protein